MKSAIEPILELREVALCILGTWVDMPMTPENVIAALERT